MGESKRRKIALGSNYGKPLGLTSAQRRNLIQDHFPQLFSQHQRALGYDCCFDRPRSYDTPSFRSTAGAVEKVEQSLDDATQHWQQTFNESFDFSFLFTAITNDLPVCLSDFQGSTSPTVIAVPLARQQFCTLLQRKAINLKTQQILLQDVLAHLASPSSFGIVKTILRHEFMEAVDSLIATKQDWVLPYLRADDSLDLNDEVIKNAINYALVGFLTLIATLHWSHELTLIKTQSEISR